VDPQRSATRLALFTTVVPDLALAASRKVVRAVSIVNHTSLGVHQIFELQFATANRGTDDCLEARAEDTARTRTPGTPRKSSSAAVPAPSPLSAGLFGTGGTRNESGAPRRVLHLAIGRRDLASQLSDREHLTPELQARTNASQKFLLDVEGATPKVTGYPPLPPSNVRTWASVETIVGDRH
jgi:hypothetical protein